MGALFCRMWKLQGDGFDSVKMIVEDIDEVLFAAMGPAELPKGAGVENEFAQQRWNIHDTTLTRESFAQAFSQVERAH